MAAKKPAPKQTKKVVPLEQYSKAELIALVKKLQREVTRLKALVDVPPLKVTHVELGADTVSELVPQDTPESVTAEVQYFEDHAERFADAHKGPEFPWEKK